jgi:hypothetical protein
MVYPEGFARRVGFVYPERFARRAERRNLSWIDQIRRHHEQHRTQARLNVIPNPPHFGG